MTIMTKTGDEGKTTCGNKRVYKDDLLVEAVGSIDELQSNLGMIKIVCKTVDLNNQIENIQRDLLMISGELACGFKFENLDKRIIEIENSIKKMEEELPELKEFIIPGVNLIEAQIQIARTVCRRAERVVVSLKKSKKINNELLKYLNRLSDYLFLEAIKETKK